MEFVILLAEIAFYYFLIKIAIGVYFKIQDIRAEDELRSELKEKVAKLIHPVKEEIHNGHMYWFDAETDQFLGQGANLEEVKAHLKERFKGHIFMIDEKNALAGPDLSVYNTSNIQELNQLSAKVIK